MLSVIFMFNRIVENLLWMIFVNRLFMNWYSIVFVCIMIVCFINLNFSLFHLFFLLYLFLNLYFLLNYNNFLSNWSFLMQTSCRIRVFCFFFFYMRISGCFNSVLEWSLCLKLCISGSNSLVLSPKSITVFLFKINSNFVVYEW